MGLKAVDDAAGIQGPLGSGPGRVHCRQSLSLAWGSRWPGPRAPGRPASVRPAICGHGTAGFNLKQRGGEEQGLMTAQV